jgi:hypothetical protein
VFQLALYYKYTTGHLVSFITLRIRTYGEESERGYCVSFSLRNFSACTFTYIVFNFSDVEITLHKPQNKKNNMKVILKNPYLNLTFAATSRLNPGFTDLVCIMHYFYQATKIVEIFQGIMPLLNLSVTNIKHERSEHKRE